MAKPRQTSVEDDWQEIDTDSFSVLSMSTEAESADEYSEEQPQAEKHRENEPQAPIKTKATQHGFEVQTLAGSADTVAASISSSQKTRSESADSATLVPKPSVETLAARLRALDISEADSKHDPAKDRDHDKTGSSTPSPPEGPCAATNPPYLHSIVTSAMKHINAITNLAVDMSPYLSAHIVSGETSDLVSECKKLESQLQTLADIISGYIKHWDTEKTGIVTGSPVPLDPGLHDWLSGLRTELMAVEKLLQYQIENQHKELFDEFYAHIQALTDFSDQMDGFLPIIVVDFDEFHTAHMTYQSLSEQPDLTPAQHAHRSSQTHAANKDVADLRRALYDLKDQISSSEEELDWLQANSAEIPVSFGQISKVNKAYITIRNTLSRILSNNPSDWLDYSIAGGLTYAEFTRISAEDVRSLKGSLKEATDDLFLQRRKVESTRYMNDPDGHLQLDVDLTSVELVTRLEGLQVIGEILTSMFVRGEASAGR